ncbi:hypothetical protein PVAP13_7NG066034, partial [Panicum virgatum]
MDNSSKVVHEEALVFHLGAVEDISSDGHNTSLNKNSPLVEDGNDRYDKEIFRKISHAAEWYTAFDEYWDIVKKTFATKREAYRFNNKYTRDKGFSVRKQKVR